MCMALVGLCASAQEKGQFAVGLNAGYAPSMDSKTKVSNAFIGVKAQYNLSDPFRLEAVFNYGFEDKKVAIMDYAVNAHYIFKVSEKINIYPLVGVGAATAKVDVPGADGETKFMINAGAGAEYNISEKFAIGLEVKYQYIDKFSRLPFNLGVTYRF